MMHLFINALAASAGGGLTYVRNVVPHLAGRCDLRATILVTSSLRKELGYWENICFIERQDGAGAARRFWHEQRHVAALARRSRADVLICAGNFALWNSPVRKFSSAETRFIPHRIFDATFVLGAITDYGSKRISGRLWRECRSSTLIALLRPARHSLEN